MKFHYENWKKPPRLESSDWVLKFPWPPLEKVKAKRQGRETNAIMTQKSARNVGWGEPSYGFGYGDVNLRAILTFTLKSLPSLIFYSLPCSISSFEWYSHSANNRPIRGARTILSGRRNNEEEAGKVLFIAVLRAFGCLFGFVINYSWRSSITRAFSCSFVRTFLSGIFHVEQSSEVKCKKKPSSTHNSIPSDIIEDLLSSLHPFITSFCSPPRYCGELEENYFRIFN